jgi:hypothetical protein
MEQGYKDSKRILEEAFQALETVEHRNAAEKEADDSVEKLKNRKFILE